MYLFIDGSITPYQIARYNALSNNLGKQITVWFQDHTEKLRDWKEFSEINFNYQVLDVIKIHWEGIDLLTLRINKGVFKKLNQLKDDLERIVITGWDQPICLTTVLWAKKNKIPVTLRAGSTAGEKSILRTVTKPYVKWYVSLFDDYISYGTASSEYLASLGAPKDKILKYYNTVDVNNFIKESKKKQKQRAQLRNDLGVSPNDFVILSSGRFVKYKQFDVMIDVFKRFNQEHPATKLVILGDGPEMERCKKKAKELLNNSIFLPGFIQQHKLVDYYVLADTFVLPSSREVWGLVVNEALACGLPILVSEVAGCVPELVIEGKTGFTFDASSRDGILESLEKMHSIFADKQRFAELRKNCVKQAQQFTIDRNVENLRQFWRIASDTR